MSKPGEFTPPFLRLLKPEERQHFKFLDYAEPTGITVTGEEYESVKPLYSELESRLKVEKKSRSLPTTAVILGLGMASVVAFVRRKK